MTYNANEYFRPTNWQVDDHGKNQYQDDGNTFVHNFVFYKLNHTDQS